MIGDYNFTDEDCNLIRNSSLDMFRGLHGLIPIMASRKTFVQKTKGLSGSDKSKIINELLIMFEEHTRYTDKIIYDLMKGENKK